MKMQKKQIFILGASGAYGVGSTKGGWAGLIKQYVHTEICGKPPFEGERAEVYNFAKPGAEVQFVLDTFQNQLDNYWKKGPISVFMSVGLNDTKATQTPDNYVSNTDKFEQDYTRLLESLTQKFNTVNVLSFYALDESKVSPKISPFDGAKIYYNNARIQEFNGVMKKVCARYSNVNFIDLSGAADWQEKCLFVDGLHPNDTGHQMIFDALKNYIDF